MTEQTNMSSKSILICRIFISRSMENYNSLHPRIDFGKQISEFGGGTTIPKLVISRMPNFYVRASWLPMAYKKELLRQLVRYVLFREEPAVTESMVAGQKWHEKFEAEEELVKDVDESIQRINRREDFNAVALFTSTLTGLCGSPDLIRFVSRHDSLEITVVEYKSHLEGRFMTQLAAYALILSDRDGCYFTMAKDHEYSLRELLARDEMPFYEKLRDFKLINVRTVMKTYLDGKTYGPDSFSRNFHILNRKRMFAVIRARKKIIEALKNPTRTLSGQTQMRLTPFMRHHKDEESRPMQIQGQI